MDGSHYPLCRIVEEDGNAIGRPYAYGNAGKVGDEGIVSFQFLPGHACTFDDGDTAAVDLVPLRHFIGKNSVPLRGKCFHTGTQVIFQQSIEHDFKFSHFPRHAQTGQEFPYALFTNLAASGWRSR